MKKIKISFFETNEKWEIDYFKSNFPSRGFELEFNPGKLSSSNAKRHRTAEIASVFIYSKIDEKVLATMLALRFIATNSTGFDHIDIEAADKRGVRVANVPSYGENTVAEHTFALLLSLSRKILESGTRTRAGIFSTKGLRGFDLKGRTLGVVGTGHIGQHVVRIAHGFEMKILAYDPFPKKDLEQHYPLRYVSLEKLLIQSDVVTLHVPYNPKTHHLINAKNLKLFKPDAVIINTARGGLIETSALYEVLKKGKIAGAGLDVLEEEGIISEDNKLRPSDLKSERLSTALVGRQLLSLPSVIVTPHNAFNSKEAVLRIAATTVENIKAFVSGKPINLLKFAKPV